MAGLPSDVGGMVISNTPNSFFFMGWVFLSHLSRKVRLWPHISWVSKLTEVADERSLDGVGSPFSVDNGAIWLRVNSKAFRPLR